MGLSDSGYAPIALFRAHWATVEPGRNSGSFAWGVDRLDDAEAVVSFVREVVAANDATIHRVSTQRGGAYILQRALAKKELVVAAREIRFKPEERKLISFLASLGASADCAVVLPSGSAIARRLHLRNRRPAFHLLGVLERKGAITITKPEGVRMVRLLVDLGGGA